MIILLTGANGLLGQKLAHLLRAQKHTVRGFQGDIRNAEQVHRQIAGVDLVVHLAAVLDETDARTMREVNVEGSRNVLDACEKNRIQRLLLVSTAGVHAKIQGTVNEQSAMVPETDYEKTKAEAEKLAHSYLETVPLTIVRPALVMGPNVYWKGIVHLVKKDFPVIGNGKNAFSTISADDAINAIEFLLFHPNAIGETYLVAGAGAPCLDDIVMEIRSQLGLAPNVRHIPFVVGMLLAIVSLAKTRFTNKKTMLIPSHIQRLVRNRAYDTQKIEGLGFVPKDDLKTSVRKMLVELGEIPA